MKKIFPLIILILGITANASANCLMYHDFENIADNAVTYISGAEDILTSSSNNGIKSYDFIYENGSARLCFAGYKSNEINGNASRKFEFLFPEYSLEKYPETKLVLGYDETVYERVNDNFEHMIAGNNNARMSQLFVFPNKDTDTVRMCMKDTVKIPHETNTEYKLIADMKTQKFIFAVGDDFAKEYDFQQSLTELSKIVWFPNKDEKYSIDNIYAWVVPNTFSVKSYAVDMSEKKISLYLSAPADKSVLDKITLNGVDGATVTQDFEEARIDITSDKIGYGKKYTVNFGEGFKDIAGNAMSGEIEVETEAFPQFDITTEIIGSKYRIYAQNTSANNVNAYIIAGFFGENGKLEECAFFAADFAPNAKQGFECEFKSDGTLKVFAAEKAGE